MSDQTDSTDLQKAISELVKPYVMACEEASREIEKFVVAYRKSLVNVSIRLERFTITPNSNEVIVREDGTLECRQCHKDWYSCQCDRLPLNDNEIDNVAIRLLSTTDAEVWADTFMEMHDHDLTKLDKYTMITWFANAIETGIRNAPKEE